MMEELFELKLVVLVERLDEDALEPDDQVRDGQMDGQNGGEHVPPANDNLYIYVIVNQSNPLICIFTG